MDDREAENEVRPSALYERLAFEPAPTEGRRRIGDVYDERQNGTLALGDERAVETVDRHLVGVDSERVARVFCGDARIPAVVAAEVPDESRPHRSRSGRDKLCLSLGFFVCVRVAGAVTRPGRLARREVEPPDKLPEARDVRLDQLSSEPGRFELFPDSSGSVAVLPLEPLVQENVADHASSKQIPHREESSADGGLDSFERASEERLKRHTAVRLQEQRVKEEHAELAVAGPRLARPEALERADVDEDGPWATPLDVVRRRVLEDQSFLEAGQYEVQLEQRRVLEHRKGPLVRIRDERHSFVPQQRGPPVPAGWFRLDQLSRHEVACLGEARVHVARGERLPVVEAVSAQRAQDVAE